MPDRQEPPAPNPRTRSGFKIALLITQMGLYFVPAFLVSFALIAGGLLFLVDRSASSMLLTAGICTFLLTLLRLLRIRRDIKTAIAATLKKHGFCPHCSYDLRASTTRCPECGRPIHPAASQNIEI